MDEKWKMADEWQWNNGTKITLILVIIGIVLTLLMKYLKVNS